MNKKIKALWLCSWYPNRTYPTSGSFIRRQLKTVQPFCDVAVIFVTEDKNVKKIEVDIIDDDGILTFIAYTPNTSSLLCKLFYFVKAYIKLFQRLLKSWGIPSIVHLNVVYPAGLYALILNTFRRIPFVISEHSSIYRPERQAYNGFFLKNMTHICFKRASSVIALTDFNIKIMREVRHLENRNYLVLPNVVDTSLFTPIENSKISNDVFTFLHISGLHDSIKNISGILRSIGKLSLIRQDFIVNVFGDIGECPPYLILAQELNILHKFITFSAEIPLTDVAVQMQKADTFILFSHVEGLPCVILEAMATGLSVIATETGGISEWVTPETGILLNIGDEAGLVEAMNYMIDNQDKYAPSVIRSKIVEKCSVEVVGKAIVSAYEEVLIKTQNEKA